MLSPFWLHIRPTNDNRAFRDLFALLEAALHEKTLDQFTLAQKNAILAAIMDLMRKTDDDAVAAHVANFIDCGIKLWSGGFFNDERR